MWRKVYVIVKTNVNKREKKNLLLKDLITFFYYYLRSLVTEKANKTKHFIILRNFVKSLNYFPFKNLLCQR